MQAPDATKQPTGLAQYTRAAELSSNQVIDAYSTSFGWATRLLGKNVRQSVKNIYALVRVADEIVDGAAAEAAANGGAINPAHELDRMEAETYEALANGFSSNLVIHAFAVTANEVGFGRELIEPFFYSMRADLTEQEHDQAGFDRYVYGSAEVVGLMCLAAFIKFGEPDYSREEKLKLAAGARALGSAFQKVNFLRDLAADFKLLGRSYFPGVTVDTFSNAERDRLVADIQADIDVASAELPNLPRSASRAVAATLMLFEALNRKIANTPAELLVETRIRVPNSQKLVILLRAALGATHG
jgi:phytoene/squalene synthetase